MLKNLSYESNKTNTILLNKELCEMPEVKLKKTHGYRILIP